MSIRGTDGRDQPSSSPVTGLNRRTGASDNYSGLPAKDLQLPTTRAVTPARDQTGPVHQLSPLDLQLLDAESSDNPLHIGAVTILQPDTNPLHITVLRELIAARLHLVTPLRRRLRTVPLGLDLPYWQECSSIDLRYHVRAIALMPQADEQQFADLIARLHVVPLDRSRPLWTCHLISGLPDGRQALYTKIHHAVIDGISAAEIMAAFFDVTPDPESTSVPDDAERSSRTPTTLEMLATSIPNALFRQATRARALLSVGPTLLRAANTTRKKHPDLPFNEPNTPERSFAYVSLSLDEVKTIKRTVDGTVNDVVMTLCTTALRRWLVDHGLPTDRPLLSAIPVSVREPEQYGTAGNQFSVMLCELPVNEPEPAVRLKLVRDNMLAAKASFHAAPSRLLHEASTLLSPLLHGIHARTLLRIAAPVLPLANVIISNVPGPQIPLYVAGIPVIANYPASLLTDLSGGINITVMSYDGRLDFGIIACSDTVPHTGTLAHHLRAALAELSGTPTPPLPTCSSSGNC